MSEPKENRSSFFNRLINFKLNPKEMLMVETAYNFAKYGHRGQQRDNGERYFEHCRRTAIILMDELDIFNWKVIVIALMHDIIEDSHLLTPQLLETIFGRDVAYSIQRLTKPKKTDTRFDNDAQRHRWYFRQLHLSLPTVKLIKLCDRLQNMREIGQCAVEKQARKIKETREVYLELIDEIEKYYPKAAAFFRVEFEKVLAPYPV